MSRISNRVIGSALEVHRNLGCGFLERVYANALNIELTEQGIEFERQVPFKIRYKRRVIGAYYADFVVEKVLLLELKAASALTPKCESQPLNYLHASGMGVGLLLNFGSRSLQIKRMVTKPDSARVI
jgi:GxxExxY protein